MLPRLQSRRGRVSGESQFSSFRISSTSCHGTLPMSGTSGRHKRREPRTQLRHTFDGHLPGVLPVSASSACPALTFQPNLRMFVAWQFECTPEANVFGCNARVDIEDQVAVAVVV